MTFENKPFLVSGCLNRKNLCPHYPPHPLTMLGFHHSPVSTEISYCSRCLFSSTCTAPVKLFNAPAHLSYSSACNMGTLWGYSWKEPMGGSVWNRPSSGRFLEDMEYISILVIEWNFQLVLWERNVFTHGTCSQNLKFWRSSRISGEMGRKPCRRQKNKLWNHHISSSNKFSVT